MSYNNNNYHNYPQNYPQNYQQNYQQNYPPNYQQSYQQDYQQNPQPDQFYNAQSSPNQRHFMETNTGNDSTKSLGGATAIGTPRINPTGDRGEIDSIDSRDDVYNREVTTSDATDTMASHQYGQQRNSLDEGESHSGSTLTKRDSTAALTTQQPLIGQSTYDVGGIQNPHYNDYNHSSEFYSQDNNPYYDEEATRHNTLTSRDPNTYNFENDYTDRDFPGGGKGARQSMTGEHLTMPTKKRRKCCCCCSWPICILITLFILTGLGITAFFVIPRIPVVSIIGAEPTSKPNISEQPPFIDLNFNLTVGVDNHKNYVPYKFNKIEATVYDREVPNSKPIATGTTLDYTLKPKINNTIYFEFNVNYSANSKSDPIIQDFISACSPNVSPNRRRPLKLRVDVELSIWGIDWIYKPKIPQDIPDMGCPINV